MGRIRQLLLVMAASAFLMGSASAVSLKNIRQIYTEERQIIVFSDTDIISGGGSCMISGQPAEILAAGPVMDGEAVVKTTILIDVSMSIPKTMRTVVLDAVDKLIEKKSAEEEYRIVTFDEQITTVQDFTADRYDLASALDNVIFDGDFSGIYDAVSETIPPIGSVNGAPALYRTIVITDGADETPDGITKEELFLKLQGNSYPVDVLTVSENGSAGSKELSAIARISGGYDSTLAADTDLDDLARKLGVDSYHYFAAAVPEALLDGSVRQLDITSGDGSVSVDVKFPAIYMSQEEPAVQPEAEAPAASEPEPEMGRYGLLLGAGIGLFAVIVLAFFLLGRRKKKQADLSQKQKLETEKESTAITQEQIETEYFEEGPEYAIKLSDGRNPGKAWTHTVSSEIQIGRADHCTIQLLDSSVSREHCKIVVQGGELLLVDLDSSNKAQQNGKKVFGSVVLHSGDVLKFGREILHVDYIQRLDVAEPKDMNASKSGVEGPGTKPIF